ncbi:MAG: AI-2E family transporter [Chloroflexi bacterium]|nr:AI-2E family transporter [Chloroflexota bacterium]
MRDVDWERLKNMVVTVIGIVLLLAGAWLAAERLSKILLMVLMAALIAYAAHPLVAFLTPRLTRAGATVGVYVVFLVLVVAAGSWLVGQLVPQVENFAQSLPNQLDGLQAQLARPETKLGLHGVITGQLENLRSAAPASMLGVSVLSRLGSAMANVVLTVFISLYFVLDGERILDAMRALVPDQHDDKFVFVGNTLHHIVGAYIRGQLLMAIIVSISTGLGMWLLGVQYPLVLAVCAFIFQLIPMIGPFMTGTLAVIVAAFQGLPLVVYVLVYYLTVQVIESNVLGPRISGRAVGLHPVASLLALITGATLFGFWGALLAVPLAGLGYVIATACWRHYQGAPAIKLVEPRIQRA